jgi:hypothetical protein
MRRLAAPGVLLVLAAALAPFAWGAAPPRSCAQAEIETVVRAGVMGADAQSFRPDDALTQSELRDLIGSLTGHPVAAGFTARPVTIAAVTSSTRSASARPRSSSRGPHAPQDYGCRPVSAPNSLHGCSACA